MKIVTTTFVLVALAQVALGRPQSQSKILVSSMPPLVSTTATEVVNNEPSVDTSTSTHCECPNGDYPCNKCWNKVKPKYLTVTVFDTNNRPFGFAYMDQQGTTHEQSGFISGKGLTLNGVYSYIDHCTGAKIEQKYTSDHTGHHASAVIFGDGTSEGDEDFQEDLFPPAPIPVSPPENECN